MLSKPFKAAAASTPHGDNRRTCSRHVTRLNPRFRKARDPNSGLVVIPYSFTVGHRADITSLATRYRVPAVYLVASFAEVGGLISYGPVVIDEYRRVGRMLIASSRARSRASFPFKTPVKFELVINLKTAKSLGIDVPSTTTAPRRRGDRIGILIAVVHEFLVGTKPTWLAGSVMSGLGSRPEVRFRGRKVAF